MISATSVDAGIWCPESVEKTSRDYLAVPTRPVKLFPTDWPREVMGKISYTPVWTSVSHHRYGTAAQRTAVSLQRQCDVEPTIPKEVRMRCITSA